MLAAIAEAENSRIRVGSIRREGFCHRKKGKWFGKVVENVAIKRQAKCKRTGQIGGYVSVDVIRNRSGNEAQNERYMT